MNESITESIVRDKFKPFEKHGFIVEEQQSENPRIRKLLQYASKHGSGKGYPEFIVRSEEDANFLLTVECKADTRFHQSKTLDQYSKFAVDGALLYSSYLSKEFDVISLGVSGQSKKELKATSYLQLKTSNTPNFFCDGLLGLDEYKEKYIYDDATKHQRYEELLDYNKELNQTLHTYKIPESNRSLLLSGILIALEHDVFKQGYTQYKTSQQLADNLVNSVVMQLQEADIQNLKVETLQHAYSFIKTNATLTSNKDLFINLISDIDKRINSFVKTYRFYDIFGDFYIEFLRYANSDKGLGIVLTPKHITELFCDIGGVTKDSVIFDNCCGTGGFLISGMRKMLELANHEKKKEQQIKEKQIVGIEFQDSIFPLACSNMIVHGDGKTNLFNADCFDKKFKTGKKIKAIIDGTEKEIDETVVLTDYIKNRFNPSVGLLNPPYKTDKNDIEELEFVLNNLEGLAQNALCVALVPMSCVLSQKGDGLLLKERIIKNHTLEAVMSLPDEIFHNSKVGVVTCAIVIRAHIPQPKGFKSYFGYWKDDGFIKKKLKGRVDGGRWNKIKEKWIQSFQNKEAIAGLSVVKSISVSDEWCAEAYMETDYSILTEFDFIKSIKSYISFKFLNSINKQEIPSLVLEKPVDVDIKKWRWFKYGDLFILRKGKRLTKENMQSGQTPFIAAIDSNNGWRDFIDETPNHDENTITINYNGSVGEAFYQPVPFCASDDCNVLYSDNINVYTAMFLVTIIKMEKYRFNYGRKWHIERMEESQIKLPVDKQGNPDWQFMEDYIKSLPYSKNL